MAITITDYPNNESKRQRLPGPFEMNFRQKFEEGRAFIKGKMIYGIQIEHMPKEDLLAVLGYMQKYKEIFGYSPAESKQQSSGDKPMKLVYHYTAADINGQFFSGVMLASNVIKSDSDYEKFSQAVADKNRRSLSHFNITRLTVLHELPGGE